MSDNSQNDGADKSHEPTPQKLRQSREKGDVPYSSEATGAVTYAAFFVALIVFSGWMVGHIFGGLVPFLKRPDEIGALLLSQSGHEATAGLVVKMSLATLALMAILAVSALGSAFAQQAFAFAPSKIKPKLSRISLIGNAKQKYGVNGLSEFVKRLAKLSAILAIVLFALKTDLWNCRRSSACPPRPCLTISHSEAGVLFRSDYRCSHRNRPVADLPWTYFQHRKRLMMTHQEVRQENKETEGDPTLKSARRQKAEALAHESDDGGRAR